MNSENIEDNIFQTINNKIDEMFENSDVVDDFFIPTYIPHNNLKKILVISGGGIKGISFLGALHGLLEANILQNIETYAGSSIGALLCFLLNIGYTPLELFEFVKKFDLNKLKSFSIKLFFENYGLDNGDKIMKVLAKFMISKDIKSDITLLELFNKTNKSLIITAVNINNQNVEYLSHTTYPELSVIQAIRMSISIPFVFTPIQFNKCFYVDGGCIDNFPLHQFIGNEDKIIGIYATEEIQNNKDINSLDEYAIQVIYSIVTGITSMSIQNFSNSIIQIKIKTLNVIDFNITNEKKNDLFNSGYKAAYDFLLK